MTKRWKRRMAALTGAIILIWGVSQIGGSSTAHGAPDGASRGKIAPGLEQRIEELFQQGREGEEVPLIIQTWGHPGRKHQDQADATGGRSGNPFRSIHAFPARVPAQAVEGLSRNPTIRRISYDWPVKGALDVTRETTGALAAALSSGSGSGLTGSGIGVAVLDSGVALQADLAGTFAGEVDFVDGGDSPVLDVNSASDPFGHGTHVAGIIAGSGAASSGSDDFRTFAGIAPAVSLISLRVLNGEGSGSVSDLIEAVDWVLENHEAHNIRVLNVSLGHGVGESYTTDPLCQALEMAWNAGIVVVVSAGNLGTEGHATITSPANHPAFIAVGAAEDWDTIETTDDLVAAFSSVGPTAVDGVIKPDIIAPGTSIVSLRSPGSYIDSLLPDLRLTYGEYRAGADDPSLDSPYIALSGTSMAAPVVAGAVALLLEQDPQAAPDDVKARLMLGARKVEDSIVARGAGLLNITAALQLGAEGVAPGSAPSPRLRVVQDPEGVEIVELQDVGTAWGDPLTWSSDMVWGDIAIWGVSSQWTDTQVWSEIAIWGTSATSYDAEIAIWGTRASGQ